jgi:hypothetical protein
LSVSTRNRKALRLVSSEDAYLKIGNWIAF